MVLAASRRVLAGALVAAAVMLAVSCGNDDPGPPIVVGAGDSVESNLLAHIYSGALARVGVRTSVTANLGGRADYLAALDDGRVGLVGEHSGALLGFLDAGSEVRTPEKVTDALSRALPEGLVVADPADGTDMRPRVLLTSDRAARDNVKSIGDLLPRCDELEFGVAVVPSVLATQTGSVRVAGCGFAEIRTFADAAELRKALLDGQIQAAILTGPPAVVPGATDGLTILSDDDYAVRAENVLPVLRKGLLDDRRIKKLNYVAGELTTDELADMIRRVCDGAVAADVARTWLDSHAL
jgi:osmoprotectant transport system substrate-binding protein